MSAPTPATEVTAVAAKLALAEKHIATKMVVVGTDGEGGCLDARLIGDADALSDAHHERYVLCRHANLAQHVGLPRWRMAMTARLLDPSRQCTTLAQLLRWRATHAPDQLGYRFLVDGESAEATLTYGDLDRRAGAIAAALRSLDATGERALLIYPPGLDFVAAWFGCAYAGATAVVVPPPHPARARRFMSSAAAIASDARPAVVLTTAAIRESLPAIAAQTDDLRAARWLATDRDVAESAPEWQDPAATSDAIAFLQYTSGSTTAPKGVMVTHRNLMHNLRAIEATFWRPSDRGSVSWLPPYHDMGLIGAVLAPLYLGSPVTLLSPGAFVQRPRRWVQEITRFQGAVSGGPNFAYDLCVRRITPEQRAGLDLSSWRVAFNGAEPIDPRTMQEFLARFAPCGFAPEAFKPCYGLAEATLLVSVHATPTPPRIRSFRQSDLERHRFVATAAAPDGARTLVSCGQPMMTVAIVDPESLRRCPAGVVGEIWVSGASVAVGYWHQRSETDQTFHASLTDDGDASTRFLRTGDLGFMLDGELFVTGRRKDLIIIDGSNHYPQDIERTVGACHAALAASDCAAFAVEADGREALVVVAGMTASVDEPLEAVERAIRTAVSEDHDLRIHDLKIVRRGSIPITASGKVRRGACRAAYLTGTLETWRSLGRATA